MTITPVELRGGDGVSQIKCIQELVSLNRKMKKLTICRGLYLLLIKKKHSLYTRSHQPAQCRTFVPIARLQQTIDLSADLIFALSLLQDIAKKDHNVFPKSSFDDLYSHLYFLKANACISSISRVHKHRKLEHSRLHVTSEGIYIYEQEQGAEKPTRKWGAPVSVKIFSIYFYELKFFAIYFVRLLTRMLCTISATRAMHRRKKSSRL